MRFLVCVLIGFFLIQNSYAVKIHIDTDQKLYQKGLNQYRLGSYSVALDYFMKLLKPNSKYYSKALLMLSKTYYAIGRKTGDKKFFWQALNYLQLYFISKRNEKLPWDYYYTKARIYEALSFYEQALAIYRVAFLKAKTQSEKIDTTIGIVRTALWSQRKDIADVYFVLVSTSKNLSPFQKREILFLKGLILFLKGDYDRALPFFLKLYREFEDYLIDNPDYYFYVAEDIYRDGNLNLSEQLFRRIISLTKSPEVIRKSFLRLGDIELKKGNRKLAFVYYYAVVRDYPKSNEAIVARLKIIPMMRFPDIRYRALLCGDEAFKEPIPYITKILVNYRTTYVGVYALADLGYLVFKLGAPEKVFKRLTWEVSLIFPEQVKYEQREFFRNLWKFYLMELPSKKMCELYRSNPRFFQEIFGKEVLLRIERSLKVCNCRRLRIELLKFMINRWKSDEDRLLLAEALFDDRDFKEALDVLNKIKNKNSCEYKILKAKINLITESRLGIRDIYKFISACNKRKSLDVKAITLIYFVDSGDLNKAYSYLKKNKHLLDKLKKNMLLRLAVLKLLDSAILNGYYNLSFIISKELVKMGNGDCYVGSFYTISSVRLEKLNDARKGYSLIKDCVDDFALVAKTAYEDAVLEERDGGFQGLNTNRGGN